MDWNLFWTALGAIGTTLGAFATTSAVIVALWQTKYANKKKLKLSFSDDVKVIKDVTFKTVSELISLKVSNIGNREVILERWGFKVGDKREILIFSEIARPNSDSMCSNLTAKFPYSLDIENSVSLYYEKNLFIETINDEMKKNNELEKEFIEFFVRDKTGKTYILKTDKKFKDYMVENKDTKS